MHGTLQRRISEAREIERHIMQGRDKIVAEPRWVDMVRKKWPFKTTTYLACCDGTERDKRTAERWVSGEFDPPMPVVLKLQQLMVERK